LRNVGTTRENNGEGGKIGLAVLNSVRKNPKKKGDVRTKRSSPSAAISLQRERGYTYYIGRKTFSRKAGPARPSGRDH